MYEIFFVNFCVLSSYIKTLKKTKNFYLKKLGFSSCDLMQMPVYMKTFSNCPEMQNIMTCLK